MYKYTKCILIQSSTGWKFLALFLYGLISRAFWITRLGGRVYNRQTNMLQRRQLISSLFFVYTDDTTKLIWNAHCPCQILPLILSRAVNLQQKKRIEIDNSLNLTVLTAIYILYQQNFRNIYRVAVIRFSCDSPNQIEKSVVSKHASFFACFVQTWNEEYQT